MRYNQLLTQLNEVQWQGKSIDFILGTATGSMRGGIAFPISDKMLKRIHTVNKGRTLHGFGGRSMGELIKIQNSKRTISSTTNLIFGCNGGGCWANGMKMGAFIEGDVLLSVDDDIMSSPDKQGRRWVDVSNLFDTDSKIKMVQTAKAMRNRIILDVLMGLSKKYKEYTSNIMQLVKSIEWSSNSTSSNTSIAMIFDDIKVISPKLHKLLVSQTIKRFYNGTEKFINKHFDKFINTSLIKFNTAIISDSELNWNEVLIDNFKIIEFFVPEYEYERIKGLITGRIHNWNDDTIKDMSKEEIFKYLVMHDDFGFSGIKKEIINTKVPIIIGDKEYLRKRYRKKLNIK